jgi:hypothetical protein
MAKSSGKGSSSGNDTVDKIAKAAMSKEMLAAGLSSAAAAISASPKARRAIRDAGLDAADTATNMMASATKLGSLIAEAVADAAQRVMSGKWTAEEGTRAGGARSSGARKSTAKRSTAKRSTGARKAGSTRAKASTSGTTPSSGARKAAASRAKPATAGTAKKPARTSTRKRGMTSRSRGSGSRGRGRGGSPGGGTPSGGGSSGGNA